MALKNNSRENEMLSPVLRNMVVSKFVRSVVYNRDFKSLSEDILM